MAWLVLLEIAGLTTAVCFFHGVSGRIGRAPLYLTLGLAEAFLFFSGKARTDGARLTTTLFDAPVVHLYVIFLPLLMVGMVLVYVLDGTRPARHLLVGLAFVYVMHGLFDLILIGHATYPAPGQPVLANEMLVYATASSRFAGLCSMVVDFLVILITYQLLNNHAARLPLVIRVWFSLVLAMVVDGLAFPLFRLRVLELDQLWVGPKLQAGLAAGIPMSLYLGWQLRRRGTEVIRPVLDIVALRRRVEEVEAELGRERGRAEQLRQTFGRYVSNEVVDALMSSPERLQLGGEVRDVTVLFADIQGYSSLAECLEPTEIISILNQYFNRVTRVVLRERGMVNEIEGDGILAVFGAPLYLEDHPDRAVRAGLGMLNEVKELNQQWRADGTFERLQQAGVDELAIRVGIHTGSAVVGNIGSELRTKYAVVGDSVNVAARVEAMNKQLNTRILVTDATFSRLTDTISSRFIEAGTHPVKGRMEPVRVLTQRRQYA
ncbi:MAG: adenylate/guanylate cyclase domain-containing protein [Myxococcota bacterium]|nr:adenylate/guanylate cyclase domain-containing protein [Myxococcota bacterium]